jgi:uncharacterized protein
MKNFLRRLIPVPHLLREHRALAFLGSILHDPQIFHLTRHSTAVGLATGLFWAFIPIPGQMVVSAVMAVALRVNLPIAVAAVWVTNPLTAPPLYYLAYRIGAVVLHRPVEFVQFEFDLSWLKTTFVQIWQPLLTGTLILAVTSAIFGYITVRLVWRLMVIAKLRKRWRRNQ